MISFRHMSHVLDAACGMGQWSIALAQENHIVHGIDLSPARLRVASALAEEMGCKNCLFVRGRLERLPYQAEAFDAVFCYGALMFTEIPQTLAEFYRVLKPRGQLYVNANSFGWAAHLLLDRGLAQRNPATIRAALRMLFRTARRMTSHRFLTRRTLTHMLQKSGFSIQASGVEGQIHHPDLEPKCPYPPPAYPSRFYGLPSIVEVLAHR
ncbi:MAG: methyltransferase domain-containing protein [Verrucomicrobiae bacterium]|nr:methyltransferase domain-containing protein [Verrucomicrobiae bacterium]